MSQHSPPTWTVGHSSPRCHQHVGDFANLVKAFIGANYLYVPFAFSQAGLGFGIIGLAIIAFLTDHCCQLIVKVKAHLVDHILDNFTSSTEDEASINADKEDIFLLKKKIEKNLSYGDIGKMVLGTPGLIIVEFCLFITQFGFCIAYFVFIGNTVYSMFPVKSVPGPANITNSTIAPTAKYPNEFHMIHNIKHIDSDLATSTLLQESWTTTVSLLTSQKEGSSALHSNTQSGSNKNSPSVAYQIFTTSAQPTNHMVDITTEIQNRSIPKEVEPEGVLGRKKREDSMESNLTFASSEVNIDFIIKKELTKSTAPKLEYLVLIPAPIFIGFSFIRNVRHMGPISLIANLSIFLGFVVVLFNLLLGLSVSPTMSWWNLKTFPIFFGQVTTAYEGIGLIIPIESSMENNRHNFSKMLHGAIFVVTCILGSFGVLGYLKYGSSVHQMINQNLPQHNWVSIAVGGTLILGIIFTYPLQLVPVIEIFENYLFGEGRTCGPDLTEKDEDEEDLFTSSDQLLPTPEAPKIQMPVASSIHESVPAWKRNVFRTSLVLVSAALAVLLRHKFAYIGAFTGSLGSTVLAYILPCLFHIILKRDVLPTYIIIKDVIVIVIGFVGGMFGLYAVIEDIIHGTMG